MEGARVNRVTCHLIVRADRTYGGRIRGVKMVAARVGRPSLAADEATIKVTLDVPDSLFDAEAVALVVEPRKAAIAIEQEEIA